jgi:hypothetical protein
MTVAQGRGPTFQFGTDSTGQISSWVVDASLLISPTVIAGFQTAAIPAVQAVGDTTSRDSCTPNCTTFPQSLTALAYANNRNDAGTWSVVPEPSGLSTGLQGIVGAARQKWLR